MSSIKTGHYHFVSSSLVFLMQFSYGWFNLYSLLFVHEFHRFYLVYLLIVRFRSVSGILSFCWDLSFSLNIKHKPSVVLNSDSTSLLGMGWVYCMASGAFRKVELPNVLGKIFQCMAVKPTTNVVLVSRPVASWAS